MIGELFRRLAESDGAGLVAGLGFFAAYLMPLAIAAARGHRYTRMIAAMNLALGWTIIGWIAALFWAVNRDLQEQAPDGAAPPLREPPLSLEPVWNDAQTVPTPAHPTRICPYCAEAIKAEAVVCRYCARDLAPAPDAASESVLPVSLDERGMRELYDLLQEMERDASRETGDAKLDELLQHSSQVWADPGRAAESRPGSPWHAAGEPETAPVERLRPDEIQTDKIADNRGPGGTLAGRQSAGRIKKAG